MGFEARGGIKMGAAPSKWEKNEGGGLGKRRTSVVDLGERDGYAAKLFASALGGVRPHVGWRSDEIWWWVVGGVALLQHLDNLRHGWSVGGIRVEALVGDGEDQPDFLGG